MSTVFAFVGVIIAFFSYRVIYFMGFRDGANKMSAHCIRSLEDAMHDAEKSALENEQSKVL